MSERLSASVDRDLCNGHGRCYMTAPEVFDCDDEGLPVVVGEATTPEELTALQRAVSNCPEQAISSSPA